MAEKKSGIHSKKQEVSGQTDIERRFKQHPLIFIGTVFVLIIVIVAFVLVPAIVPESAGSSQLDFGSWGKKPITYSSGGFFANMREQYSHLSQYYQMSDYQIWRNAFEATVSRVAILDIMEKSGYTPSKDFVDTKVAALPQFQENGRFSAVLYNKLDASTQMKMWQDMRNDMIVERYREDAGTIKSSEEEAGFIGQMAGLQRKFKMTAFPYASFPDGEIAVYANKNPDTFKTVYLSQITVLSGEREAQSILDKIRSNDITFEDAARTQSEDTYADRGGDAGVRMAFELSSNIVNVEQWKSVVNLAAGETSDVIKLPEGWIIFRANEASRPSDLQDTAALSKIRDYLMDNERGIIEDWLINYAENFTQQARSLGFDRAASDRNIEVYEFGAVPVNYGDSALFPTLNSSGSSQTPGLRNASSDENFWRAAFSTPVGEPSRPIVLNGGDDIIVVLYPEEEIENDLTAIDNSKRYFLDEWFKNETQQNIINAILTSKKLDDRFINTYLRLFAN